MKKAHLVYQQFVQWVKVDMNKSREVVNRKVFSVVLWCLIFPALISVIVFIFKKYQLIEAGRDFDMLLFFPPFVYSLYSLWPTLRALPRVFKMGGLGAMLEESAKEVEWKEDVAARMEKELPFTQKEWSAISFHLNHEIIRLEHQNRHMTILSTVVLFFMFQFLDLGGTGEVAHEAGPTGMMKMWVFQFSQWGAQFFSLLLFSALFYLSGLQFQRYLQRYLICVERLAKLREE